MLFRPKTTKIDFNAHCLKIGSEKIERIGKECKTSFFKFVGIHLDEFLEWDHHIAHVATKMSRGNYVLASAKNTLPIHIRKTIYNSLIRSHMEFGILSLGNSLAGKLKKIVNIQKKCVRNIAGKHFLSHSDPIYKNLGILKFQDLLQYNQSTFMHKLINGKQPSSFDDFFKKGPNFESGTRKWHSVTWLTN